MAKKESQNKNFVLRINTDMMDEIEKWAGDDFRSINGQILWMLDQMLKKRRGSKNDNDK